MTKAYKVHYISRIFFLVALLINIYIALDVDILYGTLYIFLNIMGLYQFLCKTVLA